MIPINIMRFNLNFKAETGLEYCTCKKAPDAVMTSKEAPILHRTTMHSKEVVSDTKVGNSTAQDITTNTEIGTMPMVHNC
jgi:5-methylcytosine-specific restriction endonuclease McrBC regulatory subunit McrC